MSQTSNEKWSTLRSGPSTRDLLEAFSGSTRGESVTFYGGGADQLGDDDFTASITALAIDTDDASGATWKIEGRVLDMSRDNRFIAHYNPYRRRGKFRIE